MNKKHTGLVFGTALTVCALSSAANASFIDVGNGLIYDDALNITWLQNANLAATETFGVSGIGANGGMNWYTAMAWIAAMNDANYLGYSNWQLPTLTPLNGGSEFVYSFKASNTLGTTDNGFNISAPGTLYAGSTANQLAHLFYNTLSNKGGCAINNVDPLVCIGPTPENFWDMGLTETGPFENMVSNRYATGVTSTADATRAFDFDFSWGQVGTGGKDGTLYAWAVLPGQATAVVPVPAAVWLFGSGLLGLVAVGRSRRVR